MSLRTHQFSGFLDRGISVNGEIGFARSLRLDGVIHGNLTQGDLLVIGATGEVHGDVTVAEIEIYGRVIGDVEAARRITIAAGGHVKGNVSTPRLVIEAGGGLEGLSRPLPEALDGTESNVGPDPARGSKFDWQTISDALSKRLKAVTSRS